MQCVVRGEEEDWWGWTWSLGESWCGVDEVIHPHNMTTTTTTTHAPCTTTYAPTHARPNPTPPNMYPLALHDTAAPLIHFQKMLKHYSLKFTLQ